MCCQIFILFVSTPVTETLGNELELLPKYRAEITFIYRYYHMLKTNLLQKIKIKCHILPFYLYIILAHPVYNNA